MQSSKSRLIQLILGVLFGLAVFTAGVFWLANIINRGSDNAKTIDRERFMRVERWEDCDIYVDLQTGVEYIRIDGSMSPLFNSYGSPLIFSGFDAREDKP